MRAALFLLGLVLLPCGMASDIGTQQVAPPPMRDSLAPLLQDLRGGDRETRIRAAKALYELGPRATPAARALVAALADPEDEVRKQVINALAEIGPPALHPLAKAVRRGDTQTRLLAIEVCSLISASPKVGKAVKDVLPALLLCVDDQDWFIRHAAILCLGDLRAGASVPRLVKFLEQEKDVELRLAAILACGQIGRKAEPAIPVLARMVVSEHGKGYDGGETAANALASIGGPAIPALANLITNVNLKPEIRCSALSALGHEGMVCHVKFPTAAPAICQALADRHEQVRLTAIYALPALDTTDKNVRVALRAAMMTDSSAQVRFDAAVALFRSERKVEAVLPTLLPALEDKDAAIRRGACKALMEIGPRASAAVPALIRLVTDADSDVRVAAIRALGDMGRGAALAIPALQLAKDDPDPSIRHAAEESLKQAKRSMRRP